MNIKKQSYAWPEWFQSLITDDEILTRVIEEGKNKNANEKQVALACLRVVMEREKQWLIWLWAYKTKYGDLEDMNPKPLNITEINFSDGVNGDMPHGI